MIDGGAVRDAGLHDFGVKVVEIQEAFVADDDAAAGIIHDEAVRHVGERVLAALGLEAQFRLEPGEAADVVADRHPAAAGKRLQLEGHDEAACKPLLRPERLARCEVGLGGQ